MTTACKNAIILANIIGADKMKKSCVFLLIMSILSLLIAGSGAVSLIDGLLTETLKNAAYDGADLYENVDAAFTDIALHLQLFVSSIVFVCGLVLGVLGIIGSIKRGRFTVVCMVLGGLPALYLICGVVESIIKSTGLTGMYGAAFLYFALYTTSAAVAFKFRKAA